MRCMISIRVQVRASIAVRVVNAMHVSMKHDNACSP